VDFVDELPRNPSGKLLKRVLRERFDVDHVTLQPELVPALRLPRQAPVTIWPRGERPT